MKTEIDWSRVNFRERDLSCLNGKDAKVASSQFSKCNIRYADLRYAKFFGTTFRACDFSGANIEHASFVKCKFIGCELLGMQASYSLFSKCTFVKTRIEKAKGASLQECYVDAPSI